MWKQVVDQFAHFSSAIVILLLPILMPWGFVLSGFMIGFVREQGQEYESKGQEAAWQFWKWSRSRWLDVLFWTLGGFVAELIFRSMCAC
ncbi:MAG: hypothetical protein ABFC84_02335 [Veillonellales bacterium]